MSLCETLRFDDLHTIECDECHTFIHRHHRWVLCVVHHAQQQGWLPTPCDLVLFDQHHDAVMPNCMEELQKLRSDGLDEDALFRLCDNDLSTLNDDWVLAGVELGLIRNCVMFGIHDRYSSHMPPQEYVDHAGQAHRIRILGRLDGELGYQGHLSDMAYSDRYSQIWDILRWRYCPDNHVFSFETSSDQVWIDIDLDVFAINWSDYILPWNDEVFVKELLCRSDYFSTKGWSPKDFILGLLDQAGLLTIATEPRHCGGFRNMMQILDRFNRYVFDDSLAIPHLSNDEL